MRPRALPRGAPRGPGRVAVTRRGDVEVAVGRPIGALMEPILDGRLDFGRMTLLAVSAQVGARTAAHGAVVRGKLGTRLSVTGDDLWSRRDPDRARLPEEFAAEAALAAAIGAEPALLDRILSAPTEGRPRALVRRPDGRAAIAEPSGDLWQPLSTTALDPDGPPVDTGGREMPLFDLMWELQADMVRRMSGLDPDGPRWEDIEDAADGTMYDLIEPGAWPGRA